MPKLSKQRGFYDDRRQFQGKDVRVAVGEQDAFVPTNVTAKSFVYGALFFVFMALCFAMREKQVKSDRMAPTGKDFTTYQSAPALPKHH